MRLTSVGRTLLATMPAIPLMWGAAFASDELAGWEAAKAGQYLDERANAWFSFGPAARGEAATRTACVSCHTTLPFALARPALRKLTGAVEPTAFERKLLAQTNLRVEHWPELDSTKLGLLYDFNDRKKQESWGTEAVLNALILAINDHSQGRSAPGDATRRAFANLWRAQAADGLHRGSWDWLDFHLEPWESGRARYFGAALAAVAVGTAPGYYAPGADADIDRHVALLLGYLKDHRAGQNLHNRAWLLWAASRLDGLLTPAERAAVVGDLVGRQEPDGGWRLASLGAFARVGGQPQDAASDGYATGFVLHVLQTAGVPKGNATVATGLAWLRAHQRPTGEWRGSSVNKERDPGTFVGRFMSDAATAYAILALSH